MGGGNDSAQKQQVAYENQLQAAQQARQNALQDQVTTAVSPLLSGNTGFTAAQKAALTGSAIDQNALRYNQAQQQTQTQLAARGENGMTPVSGVDAAAYSGLNSARAGDLSDALRTVTLNDAQQAQANRLNAASILSGNAQTYAGNVGTYGSGSASALNAQTQAQQGGFFNNFTRALGGTLGGAAGTGLYGGAGTALSKVGSGNWGW